MKFLKFTAMATDKEWIEGNKDRETYRERKEEICDKTESINEAGRIFSFLQRSETHGSGERRWFWMKKIFTGARKIICVKSVFPLTFPR